MTKPVSTDMREAESCAGTPGASPLVVGLIALCTGITVSNLYLTQPLLPLVAESLRVSTSQVGFLPTIGQIGYALGILLIVPLGDVLRRRGLLTFVLVGLIVALAGAALAPSLGYLMLATLFVSSLTILPQILIPLASQLAGDEHRGRVLAIIGAMLLQGTIFATFNMFWTTIVFMLTASPFGFSTGTAGLFGLLGILSATSAPLVGRLIDRRGPIPTLGACLLITIGSAVAFLFGGTQLAAVIIAIVLLGIGIQGGMSANQTRILTIRPEAGSRMNTIFLVLIFACGAAGGAAGSALYHAAGWSAVCISGIWVSAAGFIAWLVLDYAGFRNSEQRDPAGSNPKA